MSLDRLKKLAEMLPSLVELEDDNLVMQSILESATDGFWDWNIPANTEYMSDTFKKQLGYKPYELPNVPKSWMDLCNEEDLEKAHKLLTKHFETLGDKEFKCVCRFTHKQGHEVKILCRGQVIQWDENSPVRMVGTHTDITGL